MSSPSCCRRLIRSSRSNRRRRSLRLYCNSRLRHPCTTSTRIWSKSHNRIWTTATAAAAFDRSVRPTAKTRIRHCRGFWCGCSGGVEWNGNAFGGFGTTTTQAGAFGAAKPAFGFRGTATSFTGKTFCSYAASKS